MLGLGRPEKLNPYRALVMLLKLQPFPEGLGLLLVHKNVAAAVALSRLQ